ncbi:hypothetical protein P4276_32415, partial [Bacillus thuringiensis]|nr:hypothetical protein [Bacillus thuringiensis]
MIPTILSIQTEKNFKENFEFTHKKLAFIDEIDIENRSKLQSISQISKTKYLIRFKSYSFPGCQDYNITIEAI